MGWGMAFSSFASFSLTRSSWDEARFVDSYCLVVDQEREIGQADSIALSQIAIDLLGSALAGSDTIETSHLAEAVQDRPSKQV